MSKRAEQAVKWYDSVKYKSDLSGTPISGYIAGYEQAEKDTIERAWEWMTNAKGEHTFEDFRKAMEDE